ncbi:MAG: YhbY family RNA-binding protein [Clostridia bacterium]|nr:YhbY family RNA-binding protein [Clostridia bacterium]
MTSKQRSYLKGLAQGIDATVYIGKADLTDNIVNEIDNGLQARELVKVKIQDSSLLDPKEVANKVAEELGAEFVQAIGRKFVLYRQAKDKDKRKIFLPK